MPQPTDSPSAVIDALQAIAKNVHALVHSNAKDLEPAMVRLAESNDKLASRIDELVETLRAGSTGS